MKTRLLKSLCLLLAFLMLITLPVSCKDGGDEEPPTLGETEQPDDPGRIAIVSKGTPNYAIVYGKDVSDSCRAVIDRLQTAIFDATGATVEVKEEGDTPDPTAKEILIDTSKHTEYTTIYKLLGKKQYVITLEGNKIVVAGKNNQLLEEALWCFIEQLIPNNVKQIGDKYSLYHAEFIVNYEEPVEPLFNGESLSRYRVVYSKDVPGMEELAKTLVQRIETTLDLKLECCLDTAVAESVCSNLFLQK